MNKKELNALGLVYSNEVERAVCEPKHGFPFQSKAKIFKQLVAEGFLEERTVMHGASPFSVSFSGYELTHAGRLMYCMSCEDEETS